MKKLLQETKKLLQDAKDVGVIKIVSPLILASILNLTLVIFIGTPYHYFLLGITSTGLVATIVYVVARYRWHKKVMQDMEDTHQRLMSSLEGIHNHLRLIPGGKGGEENEISKPPTIH